jgi:hypothetical protein
MPFLVGAGEEERGGTDGVAGTMMGDGSATHN